MFERLGRWVHRRRRWVLAGVGGFVVFAALWGTQLFGRLAGGGFDDPGSESARAAELVAQRLGRDDADVIVLYRSTRSTVDDPRFRAAVTWTLAALPPEEVRNTVSYWSTGSASLVSADRHTTYAVLTLQRDEESLKRIEGAVRAPGLTTMIGGRTAINRAIEDRVARDIARAEAVSLPVLLVLLVLIFGGLVAAALPLTIGVVAILGAFTALRALTYVADVSVYSVQVVTILGLGLAIDYGLFMVSRFREELRAGRTGADAVARTTATAGRTIAVSGITVAISLGGLLIFPEGFLRSMGFGGLAAVLIAMFAALVPLPALLGVLGHRVDALSVRRARPVRGQGIWYRVATSVMRRPGWYVVGIAGVLIALGLPFLRVEFGGVDFRALPAGTESRRVSEVIEADFAADAVNPIEAVLTLPHDTSTPAGKAAVQAYVRSARSVAGVGTARLTGARGDTARVRIDYQADPLSARARAIVARVRALPPPPDGRVLVGGKPAELADLLHDLAHRLPWMALIIAATTVVLLFLAFGSVVLPVKALAMNLLSLGASFGALVWIFQDGHLSGLLGFTPTGTLDATQPILVLAVVFGLSMDYEVFLISRIREQYDLTGDTTGAIAAGLQRTGGIITSAALLLVVVIGAFALSSITVVQLIGVAMIITVVLDATVIRALLVPATMRLLGPANWWAPGRLGRFYRRYGIPAEDAPGADRIAIS